MKDPVTEKKLDKKNRILEAAALLFSKKQYHEVMIEDVAKLAFIAKGTVYNYFGSKEEIYFTIIRERMDKLITSLEQKIKSTGFDSRSALKSFVIHLYMFMIKYKEFFLMYSKETLEADNQICSSINEMQVQLRDMLQQIINSGIENCFFRKIEPDFAVDLILGSIYASVNRSIKKNIDEEGMIKEREEIFNFIYEGMSSHPVDQPLAGKKIILTRTEEQNRESANIFKTAGADVISFPVLKIIPFKDINVPEYFTEDPDYIVFMSGNAVRIFSEMLAAAGIKIKREKSYIAAVGNKTAEQCILSNLTPDIIPEENNASGLIKYFQDKDIEGKRFLLPRSAQGRDEFIKFLEEKKAEPVPVDIYSTSAPLFDEIKDKIENLFTSEADIIVFASPSAFKNFLQLTKTGGAEFLKKTKIAAIGSTTGAEIISHSFNVDIQPETFSMEGLKDSIIDFYKRRNFEDKE